MPTVAESAAGDGGLGAGQSPSGLVARMAWLWWVYLVLRVRRLSDGLATALADGLYLVAWPLVAFFLPPLAALLGFVLGAMHPGFERTFSESLPLLLLLVLLGTLSGHLGLTFLAGYAGGEVFVFHFERLAALPSAVMNVLRAGDPPAAAAGLALDLGVLWLPLLIQYGLMALPLTTFPVLTKTLLRSLSVLASLGPWAGFVAAAAIHAALSFALVYFWTQSVPLLIRPLFIWRGESMAAAAVIPVQTQGLTIAGAGVVASLVRMGLQGLTTYVPRLRAPVDPAVGRLGSDGPLTPLAERVPRPLAVLGRALTTTLLLGGLYASWADWGGLLLLIVLIEAARVGLLPIPLGPWAQVVQRLPVVVRVAGTLAVLLVLSNALAPFVQDAETFRPLVLLTGVAMIVSFLFNPISPLAPRARSEAVA
ncbi:MAG: hypothetical protein ACRDJN_09515 [Chloroflexota bacterium]